MLSENNKCTGKQILFIIIHLYSANIQNNRSNRLLPWSMDLYTQIPSQLPGEYTTRAAIQGTSRLSFTCPSHPFLDEQAFSN